MTKPTDAELAEKVAVEVMGWKVEKKIGYPRYLERNIWKYGYEDWKPYSDWNDAMMAAKELKDFERIELDELIMDYTKEIAHFSEMTPKELTQLVLKAKGVEVNGKVSNYSRK